MHGNSEEITSFKFFEWHFCNFWRLLGDFDFCRKEFEDVAHAHSQGEEEGPTR